LRIIFAALVLLMTGGGAFAGTPDFVLQDLKGDTHRLSDYAGKWVVVNYWATWCPPCLEEIPELVHFHESHKEKGAVVLGVNYESVERERLLAFVEEYLITYPVLLTEPDAETIGPIPGLPTTYLIDPKGRVVARKSGAVTAHDIEQFIETFSEP